jgi:hypothetical protein
MLAAAFISRSWIFPQLMHCHSRTFNSFFPPLNPQQEHFWLVGSQRLIIRTSRPYIAALASSIVRKVRHPKSLIALANLRFFTRPLTFKSSSTTVKSIASSAGWGIAAGLAAGLLIGGLDLIAGGVAGAMAKGQKTEVTL